MLHVETAAAQSTCTFGIDDLFQLYVHKLAAEEVGSK